MIELIFAIVIIGIVLMSAPMLISTATKSGYVAIQQEAINEAATRVNMIMGYAWDENNTDDRYLPPILQTESSVASLAELIIDGSKTGRRIGTPRESERSFIRSDGTDGFNASATLGRDGGDMDDIDDFIGPSELVLAETGTGADYIEKTTVNINTAVTYVNDGVTDGGYNQSSIEYIPFSASGGTTNIKRITVTLTSSSGQAELDKTIILHAFSCNIGGYNLEEKNF